MPNQMKRNPAAGTGKVFWFSLRQIIFSKGWIGSTAVIGLLLLVGIPLILFGISAAADDKKDKDDTETEIRAVYVVDQTEGEADYNALNAVREEPLTYTLCASMDEAIGAAAGKDDAVILRVTKPAEAYSLTVYLPQVTEITRNQASKLGTELESVFSIVLMQKAELTPEGVMLLNMPVFSETQALNPDASAEDSDDSLAGDILGFLIPFMMLMVIYMMVIFYGQSMSNSVMLEKNSKLIETVLTAVHPVALMAGKLFATASAAVMQILIWLGALTGGTVLGTAFALRMMPETDSSVVLTAHEMVTQISDISFVGIGISLIVMALGFLLYLSLSTVSGAVASKQEDLNKTNIVFTFVLLASFLVSIAKPEEIAMADSGSFSFISGALWLRFCPFTAILCLPSDLVLGKVSAGVTIGSLAVLAASVVLFVVIAAAIYKMLVLYRGETPSVKSLFGMIKENLRKSKPNDPTDTPNPPVTPDTTDTPAA